MKWWRRAVAGFAILLWVRPAVGYVRARDEATGKPLRWGGREIVFTLSAGHGSSSLSSDAVVRALRDARARWSAGAACPGITIRVEPPSSRADRARRDGVNAVLIHEHAWCRDGVRERLSCYERDEQAVTTTYLDRSANGTVTIAEADIELNAVDYRWDVEASGSFGRGVDSLTNLFVHELGHVLGLAHDCDDGTLSDLARDQAGHRPPRCAERPITYFAAMTPDAPPRVSSSSRPRTSAPRSATSTLLRAQDRRGRAALAAAWSSPASLTS